MGHVVGKFVGTPLTVLLLSSVLGNVVGKLVGESVAGAGDEVGMGVGRDDDGVVRIELEEVGAVVGEIVPKLS